MMIKKGALLFMFISAFVLNGICQTQKPVINETLKLDSAVKIGKLKNGFTYYIRKNVEPKNRAIFYLANKAGSILETDNERGLAHFVEHMNFKGTKNFPKNKMIDYLQSVGVRFGADLNAYTSFDETVYQLPIPTDNPLVVEQGLQIMRDWAGEATMDSLEFETERGVIIEEKRLRKSAGERMREEYWPILLNQSRYVDRIPIGTDQVINTASLSTLKKFHQRWYRPDLEALIVVGDFDPIEMEKMIIKKFSDFEVKSNPAERTAYGVELNGKNQFVLVTDPEYTSRVIQIMSKHPSNVQKTTNDLRSNLLSSIYNQLIASRFNELSKQANPPYLQGGTSIGNFFKGIDVASTVVSARPNEIERGFKAVYTELQRVKLFGFTQSELDRVKNVILSYQESSFIEKDKTTSNQYVQDYLSHFLNGEVNPGKDFTYHYYLEALKKISLTDLKTLVNSYYTNTNRDIMVMGPKSERNFLPNEATILKWISEVKSLNIAPYVDQVSNFALMDKLPVEGKIIKETKIEAVGVTELVLNNGAKVVLKPTNFKNDQVLFFASSPGGSSLFSNSDYQSAVNATALVTSSGLGPFDSKQLPKIMSDKLANITPYISERYEGFKGSASQKDLETAMQMLYLYFTAPKADEGIFKGLVSNYKSSLLNLSKIPGQVFADTANAVLGGYNVRRTGPSLAKAEQISFKRSFEIYKDRFANAADFTFFFTGNFTDSTIKILVTRYIATLPSIVRKETWKDLGIRTPKGIIRKEVHKGTEDKATVQLVLSGSYKYTEKENLAMDALQEILNFRLLDRLRKKESGVYSPSASVSYSKYPIPEFRVGISFGCSPANVDNLIAASEDEIIKLTNEGITSQELDKFKTEVKVDRETAIKTNNFWNNELISAYREGTRFSEILNFNKELDKLQVRDVLKVAKKYLTMKNYMIFILLPEK